MNVQNYEEFISELAFRFKQPDGWGLIVSKSDKEFLANMLKEIVDAGVSKKLDEVQK